MITVKSIIHDWLVAHGFEGLWNEFSECGCSLEDLCPCQDGTIGDCQPGFKKPDPEYVGGFLIGPKED